MEWLETDLTESLELTIFPIVQEKYNNEKAALASEAELDYRSGTLNYGELQTKIYLRLSWI